MTALWLKDARFDLTLIFGVAFVAGAMAGVTVFRPELFVPMLAVHSWLFGYEHLWATYTRLLVHPDDRARFRRVILYAPPVVLVILYTIGRGYGLTGLYVVYFFGQFFHTVRQSWGLAEQYRHKVGGIPWDSKRLSEITLWSVPVWGLLHRAAQRPDEFLFQEFWLPAVPWPFVRVAAAASAALWLYWGYTRYAAWRRGELPLAHTLYMLSHLVIYLAGYILIDELCSGWLLVNVWHNVQYIAFVWMYNRRRFSPGIDNRAKALSWLSQRGYARAILYFITTIALALPVYYLLPELGATLDNFFKNTAVPAAIVIGLTLTFHHYIVDGIVWKRRNDPDFAAAMDC